MRDWFRLPSRNSNQYIKTGRLADVLALLQVLALDKYPHRSDKGLLEELQGKPQSAKLWSTVAKDHPEFFRVKEDDENPVSLVARHVVPKNQQGDQELPPEFIGKLIDAAIELHDRQVRRAERWTYLIPLWAVLIAGVFSVITALVKAMCGGT